MGSSHETFARHRSESARKHGCCAARCSHVAARLSRRVVGLHDLAAAHRVRGAPHEAASEEQRSERHVTRVSPRRTSSKQRQREARSGITHLAVRGVAQQARAGFAHHRSSAARSVMHDVLL
jgi:hypothetical protein